MQISSDIVECRLAREPAEFFLDLPPRDQADWVSALLENTQVGTESAVSVCILDTGVNNGHSLLASVLQDEDMHTVCSDWGINDHQGHGTGMAGIATYVNLAQALASIGLLTILHHCCPAKLLALTCLGYRCFQIFVVVDSGVLPGKHFRAG